MLRLFESPCPTGMTVLICTQRGAFPHEGTANATARNGQRHSKERPTPQQGTANATARSFQRPLSERKRQCYSRGLAIRRFEIAEARENEGCKPEKSTDGGETPSNEATENEG